MAETETSAELHTLVKQLEELPTESLQRHDSRLEALLSGLAAAFREATIGNACSVINARVLGATASQALLRLPVTLYSDIAASALWEVARFNAVRRLSPNLVLEIARRLVDVGSLLGSMEWRRKAFALSSPILGYSANYALAMEHAWSALMLARAIGEPSLIAASWSNLGLALSGAGLHHEGLRCFEIALSQAEGWTSEIAKVIRRAALTNIASSELCLGHHERGLRAAEAAGQWSEGDSSVQAATSRLIGGRLLVRLLIESGRVQRARSLLNELRQAATHSESEGLVAEIEIVHGLCLVAEGNAIDGLERVRKALDELRKLQLNLRDGLQNAIRAHELAGEMLIAGMLRRELTLHNRLVQQEGMLELHRAHLHRLQAEEGASPASLEYKAAMVERLALTTEMREDPTGLRVFRVGCLARLLAKEIGWSDPDAEALEVAARLHDIGKISVADDIVAARRPLTADEMQAMRAHCQAGAELLLQTELENARLAADVATYHHEAWDGSGYPHGIGGTAIPLAARIVAIADAFAAMTSERTYQTRLDFPEALQRLQSEAGSRYDPTLVPHFVGMICRLLDTVDDLDAFLAEAADRSPFMQVHRQLAQRLAEPKH